MQWYPVVIVLAAALVFGCVDGRSASGVIITVDTDNEIQQVGGRQCPHKAIPNTDSTVLHVMLTKVLACHKSSTAFKQRVKYAANTDAFRRIFHDGCLYEPSVRTCIAAVDADADTCLDATERKLWTTVIGFVQTGVTATCGDGGELVATMYGDELKAMSKVNQMRTMSCVFSIAAQSLFDREVDLSAYTLRKHNALKDGRKCIVDVAKKGGTSSKQFERFIDQLIVSMKCLTPKTFDIVPCSTLEAEGQIAF